MCIQLVIRFYGEEWAVFIVSVSLLLSHPVSVVTSSTVWMTPGVAKGLTANRAGPRSR